MGEEVKNYTTEEELKALIASVPLEPFGSRVIITINRVEPDGDLVLTNDMLAEEQYVLAVGPMAARFVSPGDKVILDLDKMTVRAPLDYDQTQVSTQIKIDPIYINGEQFAIVNDNCFKAKYK